MIKQIFKGSAKGATKVAGLYKPSTWREKGWLWKSALGIFTAIVIMIIMMMTYSRMPESYTVNQAVEKYLPSQAPDTEIGTAPKPLKAGVAMTAMTIHLIDSLQEKSGGYISNDITPPGVFMDNMPAWEYGVLRNVRDLSKVFRNNFSTSGTQTKMDDDLAELENKLSIDSEKWMLPSPEASYDDASEALQRYLVRISDEDDSDAQFYARADNLRRFFRVVSPNLGSYSQRLSESVGVENKNLSIAGDKGAKTTTEVPAQVFNKTPWYKVDDNFYEARGYAWALLQEMRAVQVDFKSVLEKKNATVYIEQLIGELEATQRTVWSPIILNGSGFGMVSNHSLVMASYLSRANAILIELTDLLERG